MPAMRMPFEKLMELVRDLSPEDRELPMGALADRWGEPAARIADAVTAVRVLNGERTYLTVSTGHAMGGQPVSAAPGTLKADQQP
jgi:hypothetical protein